MAGSLRIPIQFNDNYLIKKTKTYELTSFAHSLKIVSSECKDNYKNKY